MEFTEKGGAPNIRIVGRVASEHAPTEVKLEGTRLAFTTMEWFGEADIKVSWAMSMAGGKITGHLPTRPGRWESYDVTLVGRNVTVVRDGVTIIDNQEIPGITGGALNSREGEPGPLYIQGDHTGGMKYRNITISLPQR